MKAPLFVKIQGTLFNLDGIVSVRIDDKESGIPTLIVETRLVQHHFAVGGLPAEAMLKEIVSALKSAGRDVPVIS